MPPYSRRSSQHSQVSRTRASTRVQPLRQLTTACRSIKPGQIIAIALVLFWLIVLLGNHVFKGKFVFEGNVLAQEMNFTYAGEKDQQLFLNTISGIKKIDLEGSQPEPLVLTGKFSSSDTTLNQQISKLDRVAIKLPYAQSRFILTPAPPITPATPTQTSELSISDLRLLKNSQVNQLTYQAKPQQLSFCLQDAAKLLANCLFSPDEKPTQAKPESIGILQLLLGQQPLTVNLEFISLEKLGIKASSNDPHPISFQFTPDKSELLFTLLSPTHLYIDIPSLPPIPSPVTTEQPTGSGETLMSRRSNSFALMPQETPTMKSPHQQS